MKIFYLIFISLLLSCKGNQKTTTTEEPITIEATEGATLDFLFRKLDKGIEFYAIGHEPSWSLDMDMEEGYFFKTMEMEFNCPPVEGIITEDKNETIYRAETESGKINIRVFNKACTDNMSGEKFPHLVKVELKRGMESAFKTYEGCGRFVFDQRIHDIWALQWMNGKEVQAGAGNGELPYLEFNSTEKKILGKTGCNNLGGEIQLKGNRVFVEKLVATQKHCPDAVYEQEFLKALSSGGFTYSIKEGKLSLSRNGEEVLRFKKVD